MLAKAVECPPKGPSVLADSLGLLETARRSQICLQVSDPKPVLLKLMVTPSIDVNQVARRVNQRYPPVDTDGPSAMAGK